MTELIEHPRQQQIVVGVDGSPASMDALRWAARQARDTGGVVKAIMSWELPSGVYAYSVPMPTGYDLGPDSEQALATVLGEIRAEFPSVEITGLVVRGHAAKTLLAAAKAADLLVVGSRGHGAVVGLLLGSVSEHCVTHATCPVVVVRDGQKVAVGTGAPVLSSTARK